MGERVEEATSPGATRPATLARLAASSRRDVLAGRPAARPVVGAGLALPGIVDTDSGRLLRAPNLGWSDLDVPADLLDEAATGRPVRCGWTTRPTSAARRRGAGRRPGGPGRLADFLYLSGEVGIGGAVVVDGRVVDGRHGWAGEVGHVCVDPDGPACRCGSTGCLEQYAGRLALLVAAGLPPDASPRDLV